MKVRVQLAGVLTAGACWLAGCQPATYRRQADQAAYGIIGKAQEQALGKAEAFTVEPPADALRRRLLLEQDLPNVGGASLGSVSLQPIARWPEKGPSPAPAGADQPPWGGQTPLTLTLAQALQVAARNSRDYQTQKEDVFRAALALDLEANRFRNLLFAGADSDYSADHSGGPTVRNLANSAGGSWQRRLKNGAVLTAAIAADLAALLTRERSSSLGLFADATITMPLLRGGGRHIVTEPLTQAEREVVYSLQSLVRSRRTLAVRVAGAYLGVLRQMDAVANAEDNYKRLIAGTRRARRLADAGRLPSMQVDQVRQDELRARERWVVAQQGQARLLDAFKITLGLPADAMIELDREELRRLARLAAPAGAAAQPARAVTTSPAVRPALAPGSAPAPAPAADAPVELVPPTQKGGGPLEMTAESAVRLALEKRLDLATALGRVFDAQRRVVVAADALGAGLTLTAAAAYGGRRGLGSAGLPDARLDASRGVYTAGLGLDLPLERTAERNAYRQSHLDLEQAVRGAQELEDQIKLQVRSALRGLLQARESYTIQAQAVVLAEGRVASTAMFLEAGRAEVRDVLEAEEALVAARNALTAAVVDYRVAELELQRDMDVLEVDEKGSWHEYRPDAGRK